MDRRVLLVVVGVCIVAAYLLGRRTTNPVAPVGQPVSVTAPSPPVALAAGATADRQHPMTAPDASTGSPATPAEAGQERESTLPSLSAESQLPIDVSPGFEYLSRPAGEMKETDADWSTWRRHQLLESQARDAVWAPRMETEFRNGIQDSLTAAGLDRQRIELAVVECRSTGCEIQAVGYPEDNRNENADPQMIVPRLVRDRMGTEFDMQQYSMRMSFRPDGRLVYLFQLQRRAP